MLHFAHANARISMPSIVAQYHPSHFPRKLSITHTVYTTFFYSLDIVFVFINCFLLFKHGAKGNETIWMHIAPKMQPFATNNTRIQVPECPFVSDLFSNIFARFFFYYFLTFVFIVCLYLTMRMGEQTNKKKTQENNSCTKHFYMFFFLLVCLDEPKCFCSISTFFMCQLQEVSVISFMHTTRAIGEVFKKETYKSFAIFLCWTIRCYVFF